MTTAFGERTEMAAATGELDLADRQALRRVTGLSTELTDVTEVEYRALRLERVVLIGVWSDGSLTGAENSLRELSRLAETAGSVVLDGLIQRRGRVDPATYVGAGKAAELAGIVAATAADVARIAELEASGQALSVLPPAAVPPVSRLSTDGGLLAAAFEAGREAVLGTFDGWAALFR